MLATHSSPTSYDLPGTSDVTFNICSSVHHQSVLLNNQRDAALSSRIYSSLRGYSTCFGSFLRPSSGVKYKTVDAITGTVHVSVWFKSIERCPRSGVYFTMSWTN
jgi:hypothetical protein